MTTFEFEKFKVNAMPYVGNEYLCTVHLHNGLKYEDKISECYTVPRCERDLIYSFASPAAKNGKDKVETLIECAQDLTQMIYDDVYDKSEDHTHALRTIVQLAAEFEEIWWNTPESEREDYLGTLEEYAQGVLVDLDVLQIENRNIYQILIRDGVKQVKMLGYYYKSDNEWRLITFKHFYLSIKELKKMSMAELDNLECSVEQFCEDFDAHEAHRVLRSYLYYHATPLPYDLLSKDTPEGIYINL